MLTLMMLIFTVAISQTNWGPGQGEWETDTPENHGLSAENLEQAGQQVFTNVPERYCFVVIKDGVVVHEDYWGNNTADTKFETDSAAKTVNAGLIGVAVSQGLIDLNRTLDSYGVIPHAKWGPYWKQITARHLLAQTSGMGGIPPGTGFTYDSDTYIQHLSYLLTKVTPQKSALKFASDQFAEPLGIPDLYKYDALGSDISIGGGQLMTCRQIARVGQLILNKGKWLDSSGNLYDLVNASYVNSWTTPAFPNVASSYGYLTWLNTEPSPAQCCACRFGCKTPWRLLTSFVGDDVYPTGEMNCPFDVSVALGWLGKYLFTIPSRNMVVVTFGESWGSSDYCNAESGGYDDSFTMTETWKAFGNLTIPNSTANSFFNDQHSTTSSFADSDQSNPLSFHLQRDKTRQIEASIKNDIVDANDVAVSSCYCKCPPSQGFGRCYNLTSPKEEDNLNSSMVTADKCGSYYEDGARACPSISIIRQVNPNFESECNKMKINHAVDCTSSNIKKNGNASEVCPCSILRFESCAYHSSPCDNNPYFPGNFT